jgi:hypothetical protein
MKMKNILSKNMLLGLALGMAVASSGFAKLIEDGSSFTDNYKIVEKNCITRLFDPYQPNAILDEVLLKGTPEGLLVDGRLQEIQQTDIQHAQPNSGAFSKVEYLSSTRLHSDTVMHFENAGIPVVYLSADYQIGAEGNITLVTTNSDTSGKVSGPAYQVCHFVRLK